MREQEADAGRTVRELVRRCRKAALATLLSEVQGAGPAPYASLVLVAADTDASPLLLLSRLAVHTRNLGEDPRAALLFDGTEGLASPLAGERVTLLGTLEPASCERVPDRYLRFHPEAAQYSNFADFTFYRMQVSRAHLVAGFGRITWLPAQAVLLPRSLSDAVGEAEAGLLAELNREHVDSLQLLAAGCGAPAGTWQAIALDHEGVDLARDGERLRVSLPATAGSADELRAQLVKLARRRRRPSPSRG